jgi:hypothetical protein
MRECPVFAESSHHLRGKIHLPAGPIAGSMPFHRTDRRQIPRPEFVGQNGRVIAFERGLVRAVDFIG